MIARRSIRDEYEADKKEELLEKIKDELLGADIALTADYAAIWKGLVDGKKVKNVHQLPVMTHPPS
jgi:predicted phage-related endonuclease